MISENEGTKGNVGSGVRGDRGGVSISVASSSVDELIHFSSRGPGRGDSDKIRKLSAK